MTRESDRDPMFKFLGKEASEHERRTLEMIVWVIIGACWIIVAILWWILT